MAVSMSSSGPHQFAGFLSAIDRFPRLWQSLDVRYSAIKKDGTWYNFVTDIRLTPEAIDETVSGTFVDLARLRAGHSSLPFDHLLSVLTDIEAGRLLVDGFEMTIRQPPQQNQGPGPGFPYGFFFGIEDASDRQHTFWDPGPETTALTLSAHGGSLLDLIGPDTWRDLDRELLAHTPSYFGLDDLLRFFIRIRRHNGVSGGALFSIRAPVYTLINRLDLGEDNKLTVEVHFPRTVDPGHLRIVARGVEGESVNRYDIKGTEEAVTHEPRVCTLRLDTRGLSWIQGALILRELKVEEFELALPVANSPNPRYEALHITDQGEARLRQFVGGDATTLRLENSQEVALSWLLQLCGFQVLASGLKGFNMGSAPDLIAFVPYSRQALVIEVTRSDLATEGKLVKLHDRAASLKERLPDFQVVAVAATAKTSVTKPEVEIATSLGVKILVQGDMEWLRQAAENNQLPSKVFAYVSGARPPVTPALA